jgi:hypothetical protein
MLHSFLPPKRTLIEDLSISRPFRNRSARNGTTDGKRQGNTRHNYLICLDNTRWRNDHRLYGRRPAKILELHMSCAKLCITQASTATKPLVPNYHVDARVSLSSALEIRSAPAGDLHPQVLAPSNARGDPLLSPESRCGDSIGDARVLRTRWRITGE